MSRNQTIATTAAFVLAAATAAAAAWVSADYIERSSRDAVRERLSGQGMDWLDVRTDGLQLILTGMAPDERARFRAVTEAGAVVDPGRVLDAMDVRASAPAMAPRFALEILRNQDAVSLIGLTPAETSGEGIAALIARANLDVTDMVERVAYDTPETWGDAVAFALTALDLLPRAKISVEPGRVKVTAVADSDQERRRLERDLNAAKPAGLDLTLAIAAPRPVITPFTLRFVMPEQGRPRFEACAVDSEAARAKVLRVAGEAGYQGTPTCVIGLGVPSASWGDAAALSIATLAELGGGSVTLSDADVTLVAREGTVQSAFDTAVAELETALPDIFALSAVLPEAPQAEGGEGQVETPEFTATLSPEGQVQLRGRLYDEAQEAAVLSYGRALFGSQRTYIATRQDESLPQGWPARVLAALDVLSRLENGAVVVRPDLVAIRGVTGNPEAEAEISRILSDKLGAEANFRADIDYNEELDPLLSIPTPEGCEEQLNAVLVEQKLTFAPGEAVIDTAGEGQLKRLVDLLDLCGRNVFEVGGHTDSQGREVMNLDLSQSRAEAVRLALIERGTPPSQLIAKGYGEAEPIDDNGTEAGREANRRITFTLIGRRDREGDPIAATDTPETDDADPPANTPEADPAEAEALAEDKASEEGDQ